MHSRTRFALFAALGTCFFGLAVSLSFAWWVSDLLLAPPWYEHRSPEQGLRLGNSTDPRTDFGIEFEDVTFPTGEDATLRGWFIPGAAGAESVVVGAHGAGGDRRSFIGLVPMFHEAGYPVLLFDFRDHGVSDGAARGSSNGVREHEDLIAAAHYLREERGFRRVAVIGSSLGATSAILAAALSPRIDAVIAQSGTTGNFDLLRAQVDLRAFPDWVIRGILRVARWRVDPAPEMEIKLGPGPLGLVDRIAPRPLFLIHGQEDVLVPAEQSERLYARAREPKSLWIIEGGQHRRLRRHAGAEYAQRVLAFLDEYVPVNATPAVSALAPVRRLKGASN